MKARCLHKGEHACTDNTYMHSYISVCGYVLYVAEIINTRKFHSFNVKTSMLYGFHIHTIYACPSTECVEPFHTHTVVTTNVLLD